MTEWPWPDSLDAAVAAPQFHTVLFEDERVRIFDTRIRPGELVPVHTHRWSCMLTILSWGEFVRRDGDGQLLLDTRITPSELKPGQNVHCPPLPPHSFENVGTTEIRVISVELKE